eukprot:gnl/MRDRNA2_/MRDRNA2_38860_c0_seq2.p1 gnl/MRDRNA2_/MRDRNA2_38860_c0~~gnl/MRDRNA2_/MRDRNA2_38860_c0_seq2.p1  ORF type:complete len:402 (+),score=57.69 gnl/MRDRNA2_/MRDRNA2_38860_c0_seq2:77-1282(+)
MGCSIAVSILFTFYARVRSEWPSSNPTSQANHVFAHNKSENLVDKIVDNFLHRALKTQRLFQADLESTTLAKPGQSVHHVASASNPVLLHGRSGSASPLVMHLPRVPGQIVQPLYSHAHGRQMRSCIGYWHLPKRGMHQNAGKYVELKASRDVTVFASAGGVPGALLCDCDGTLVETERDGHRVSFNKAFTQKGYNCEWGVELYGELLTTGGGKERMTRYFKDYKPEAWPHPEPPSKDHPAIVELHKLKTSLFMEIVEAGQLPLREGVKELLAAADAAGWTLAVCSTSNEKAVTAVVQTMLPQYAKSMPIFAGDMAKKKKPDPEIYNMASRELGISPSKCVVLEDTNIGMRAGKAAGMMVVVTKSIYSKDEDFGTADLVVDSAVQADFATKVKPMLSPSSM